MMSIHMAHMHPMHMYIFPMHTMHDAYAHACDAHGTTVLMHMVLTRTWCTGICYTHTAHNVHAHARARAHAHAHGANACDAHGTRSRDAQAKMPTHTMHTEHIAHTICTLMFHIHMTQCCLFTCRTRTITHRRSGQPASLSAAARLQSSTAVKGSELKASKHFH
jgi:hypothetical protein